MASEVVLEVFDMDRANFSEMPSHGDLKDEL